MEVFRSNPINLDGCWYSDVLVISLFAGYSSQFSDAVLLAAPGHEEALSSKYAKSSLLNILQIFRNLETQKGCRELEGFSQREIKSWAVQEKTDKWLIDGQLLQRASTDRIHQMALPLQWREAQEEASSTISEELSGTAQHQN